MSIKFATGFEHADLYAAGSATLTFSELDTLFNNNLRHVYADIKTDGTFDLANKSALTLTTAGLQRNSQYPHTKHNGYNVSNTGAYLRYTHAGHVHCMYGMKTENFTNGYYVNMWWCASTRPASPYTIIHAFSDGAKSFGVVLKKEASSSTDKYLAIRNMTPGEETDYVVSSAVVEASDTPLGAIQTTFSLDNTGQATASFNGVQVTYDMSSVTGDTSFTQWQQFGFAGNPYNGMIDDIIVCDGSGTEYNTLPPSVKIPFVYAEQTYYNSTNVTPSTGTIQDVLTDNDSTTNVSMTSSNSMLRVSMPPLSAMLTPSDSADVTGIIGVASQIYKAYTTQPNKQLEISVKAAGGTTIGSAMVVASTPTDLRLFTFRTAPNLAGSTPHVSADWALHLLDNNGFHIQLDVT